MKKYILLALLLIPLCLIGQEKVIPKEILCSPVFFTTDINEGSGLFLTDSTFIYFVTARHNMFLKNKNDTGFNLITHTAQLIFYSHDITKEEPSIINLNLDSLYNMGLVQYDEKQDIAIILIGILSKVSKSSFQILYFNYIDKNKPSLVNSTVISDINKYSDVNIGNDIFLFGYPGSIGLIEKPQFDYTRPLLRKGIIAGKEQV